MWRVLMKSSCMLLAAAMVANGCRPAVSAGDTSAGDKWSGVVEPATGSQPGAAPGVFVARLTAAPASSGFDALHAAFTRANPGYDVEYHPRLIELAAAEEPRILFVQKVYGEELPDRETSTSATVGETASELTIGDIVVLRSGERLETAAEIAAVVFTVPESPDASVPTVVRPDWDPGITDVVGGCATEEGAYRRILLTWLRDNGPYTFHALNAHRVRIADSFTHYHPVDGGFDELYLVQMSRPGAKLLTSTQVEAIEQPERVTVDQAAELFEEHELAVGDLIYMPRGTIHRGVGGALVQVITAPGFRPGAEIGVDHHLRAINERLGLAGERAVPSHVGASEQAVVK